MRPGPCRWNFADGTRAKRNPQEPALPLQTKSGNLLAQLRARLLEWFGPMAAPVQLNGYGFESACAARVNALLEDYERHASHP